MVLRVFVILLASLCETGSPDTGEMALAPEGELCRPQAAEGESLPLHPISHETYKKRGRQISAAFIIANFLCYCNQSANNGVDR